MSDTLVWLTAFYLMGVLAGIVVENRRKRRHLLLDAEHEVTFINGVPFVLKRYGEEQNYPEPENSTNG